MIPSAPPAIEARHLSRVYAGRAGAASVHALTDVSLSVRRGETLGIVGESGCGKSTLARLVAGLDAPSEGQLLLHGTDIARLSRRERRRRRRDVQMVFQNPYTSLNPRQTVGRCLEEVLSVHAPAASRARRARRVGELLERVGLGARLSSRLPRQLSGGQLQRVAIARALAVEPAVLVLDEAVSALDVSVQADVINLLVDLKRELLLTYLFVSHDLGVVRHVSDHVAVMYLGRVIEHGPWRTVSDRPAHPYAVALQRAVPVLDLRTDEAAPKPLSAIDGELPSPTAPPRGCAFHPRCPRRIDRCRHDRPLLTALAPGHRVACHVATDRGASPEGEPP